MKNPFFALIAALVVSQFNLAHAQTETDPLARYALGEIPDQTVWSGSTRVFLVNSAAGGALTLTANPMPAGAISLQAEGADWLFATLRPRRTPPSST